MFYRSKKIWGLLLSVLTISTVAQIPVHADGAKIRVALYVDRGASKPAKIAFRKLLERSDEIEWKSIEGDDLSNGVLKDFDILLVPGGSAGKEAESMGKESREEVRRFVERGGAYMGVCAGAYLSSRARENYLALIPLDTVDKEHWYRVNDGTPVDVELTAAGMDVFGVSKSRVRIIYENGPIFGKLEQPDESLKPLGFFRSEVVAHGGREGVMLGAPAMVLGRYGRGLVIACSPHPEKTPGLRFMILRALKWLYEHRERPGEIVR